MTYRRKWVPFKMSARRKLDGRKSAGEIASARGHICDPRSGEEFARWDGDRKMGDRKMCGRKIGQRNRMSERDCVIGAKPRVECWRLLERGKY